MTAKQYDIIPLPKEQWKGTPIPLIYTTGEYYDVEITEAGGGCQIELTRKPFEAPVTHSPEEYDFPDMLYQDYWEKAQAWGVVEDGELLACIQTCPEEWSNRLMVTEMWVSEPLRRQGVGHRLMEIAKQQARNENRRAVILETQSCNVNAIAFYRHEGFELIGFDTCCYTNRDIQRREVRFNLGFFPDGRDGSR